MSGSTSCFIVGSSWSHLTNFWLYPLIFEKFIKKVKYNKYQINEKCLIVWGPFSKPINEENGVPFLPPDGIPCLATMRKKKKKKNHC